MEPWLLDRREGDGWLWCPRQGRCLVPHAQPQVCNPRCQVGDGSETVTVTATAVMGTGTEPVEAQCDSLDG